MPTGDSNHGALGTSDDNKNLTPPTYAAFTPTTLNSAVSKQRSTILVHQKTPLLVATPPQVTRALAYSHPFILPLNKLVGLLTWSTGDTYESFLLVAAFVFVVLYGDVVLRFGGPLLFAAFIITGMFARRYSPLSTKTLAGPEPKPKASHTRSASEISTSSTRHHKSLDSIVDELKIFTARCNILITPLLRMTEFLSTQETATSSTTRPALTHLFVRLLLITPFWTALSLRPIRIITTRRVTLFVGIVFLTWHSQPARVCRTLLWRSRAIRRLCCLLTGLDLAPNTSSTSVSTQARKASLADNLPTKAGIRFTFTMYENQRRWLGIGWTSSMLAYERSAWTDEMGAATAPKDKFTLPEVGSAENKFAKWRWVEGSEWQVEPVQDLRSKDRNNREGEGDGWVYYDNKWKDPRPNSDSWGRYTRRRKWVRDAELVEISPSGTPKPEEDESAIVDDGDSVNASPKAVRKRWFNRPQRGSSSADKESAKTEMSSGSTRSRDGPEQDVFTPLQRDEKEHEWGMGDEMRMGMG